MASAKEADKDPAKAVPWFQKAARQGYALMTIPISQIKPLVARYREVWKECGHPGGAEVGQHWAGGALAQRGRLRGRVLKAAVCAGITGMSFAYL